MLRVDQKRLSAGALLGAVVMVGWAAAATTWTLLEPELVLPGGKAVGEVAPQPTMQDYGRTISSAHLLGESRRQRVTQEVPVTRLNLELLGVYNTDAGDGFAIIREDRGDQRLYRRGAVVPGGARLSKIFPFHVVLDVDGRLESLFLDKEKQQMAGGAPAPASDGSVGERLAALRQRAMADPSSLGRLIEAKPYRRGGRMQGYLIRQRVQDPLFEEIGLKDGDVLVEINGIRLDDPKNGFAAIQELASAHEINAVVRRAGRSFTIQQRLN